MTMDRNACAERDTGDPLRPLRESFDIPAGLIYLDGNSLGALPRASTARLAQVAREEWGQGLIRSWNTARWIELPQRIGDKIASLVGAGIGETIAADSTSVNLYKVLAVATALVKADATATRRTIVSERSNFPTDLYIAQSIAAQQGFTLKLVEPDQIEAELNDSLAILMLTHVNYRSGRMHRMDELNAKAHAAGALTLWDLAHSAGAVPVNLKGNGPPAEASDFAVGCGYKYLNGGPGAPAFLWVHPKHLARMDAQQLWQPLSGWMGHAAPFEFTSDYRPAGGIARFACGTPPVLALAALECGVDTLLAADAHGGMAALRRKSLALTDLFIELVESRCAGQGLTLITPRDAHQRGSQASFTRADGEGREGSAVGAAYAIVQALIERGVIGDFRAPDVLRFGFTPLYTRFVDVWDAVEHLRIVLETGEWKEPRFNQKAAVT